MTEIIEQQTDSAQQHDNAQPLEGTIEVQYNQERHFRSKQALLDYVHVFKIASGAFGEGYNNEGNKVYVLQYKQHEQR